MFRRSEGGSEESINEAEGATPAAASAASGPTLASAPTAPTPAAAAPTPATPAFRPVPPQAAMVAASRGNIASSHSASSSSSESSRPSPIGRQNNKRVLTVGPDIQMKGEITSCDRVVIEGVVDATMRDVHTVELTESGALKGTAEVEDAEISGNFEGDLVVRGKLTIYSSGRVRGNVTYGEIEIQRGGQISGNVRNAADAKAGAQKKVA